MQNNYNLLDILSDKKVLYAEDEKSIRDNITEFLELFFDKVVSVEDGIEATYEMELESYDVLIFDICMPHMDGLEVIQKVRQKDKKIPIIILSAHTEEQYLWRAVELKITKYLKKPYDKDAFIHALNEAALELVDGNITIKLNEECTYNPCIKVVCEGNKDIKLSKMESRLLEYFIKRANQTISFEDIFEYLWGYESPSKEAIKSLVKDIRKKIGSDCIKSIYGIGYKLELD